MKNKDVEILAYENLYQFACKAESHQNFVERLQIVSNTIVLELAERINNYNPQTAFKVAWIIDNLQEEVMGTVRNINTTPIVENQPPVLETLLYNLIQLNNAKLYNDYIYVKRVFPN